MSNELEGKSDVFNDALQELDIFYEDNISVCLAHLQIPAFLEYN